MKFLRHYLFALAITLFASTFTAIAQEYTIKGRVIDSHKTPIPYATVVMLHDGKQAEGGVTNDQGLFVLKATAQNYLLVVAYMGYDEIQKQIELRNDVNLGDITLQETNVEIGEVVVKANLIRREADRFIVDVANSPHAVGRDAADALKLAPGVWVSEDNISINGASGTKIYINGRETRMSDAELINFLRSMPADEIQRIDVIPQTGAEYDASMRGGVIDITTKRKVDTGFMGNVSMRVTGRPDAYRMRPSLSLNYNREKLNIYGRVNSTFSENNTEASEQTLYREGTDINSATEMNDNTNTLGAHGGIIYEFNERHSIGAEYKYYLLKSNNTTLTKTCYLAHGDEYGSNGDYVSHRDVQRSTATMNYIYKLDDKGSELKILADYTNSKIPDSNNYHDIIDIGEMNPAPRDSIYRSDSHSHYHLATATASIEKVISPKLQLRAGVKYTFNKNTSVSNHEWESAPNHWQHNDMLSYDIGFTENIGAAYMAATANLGRWSLVAGLRGEFTDFHSADKSIKQDYFDLFPNANVSYSLSEDGSNLLIAQYSRTILRPSFWELSPYESKSSEYTVMRGNPNLKATYNNSVSLTTVLGYKYSMTVGMNIRKNTIEVLSSRDDAESNLIVLMPTNLSSATDYFANISAPIDITKWWSVNLSIMGQYLSQRFSDADATRRHFMGMGNLSLAFILPKGFYIDVDGYFSSNNVAGNIELGGMGDVNVAIKKQMFDKNLTVTLGVNNIISPKLKSSVNEEEFTSHTERYSSVLRRNVSISASWRFNTGKKFRAKSVESGSQEDILRLGGN